MEVEIKQDNRSFYEYIHLPEGAVLNNDQMDELMSYVVATLNYHLGAFIKDKENENKED
jgi:hypothetical protein